MKKLYFCFIFKIMILMLISAVNVTGAENMNQKQKGSFAKKKSKGEISFVFEDSGVYTKVSASFRGGKSPPLIRLKPLLKNAGADDYKIDGNKLKFLLDGKQVTVKLKVINQMEEMPLAEVVSKKNLLIGVEEIKKLFKGYEIVWDPEKHLLSIVKKIQPSVKAPPPLEPIYSEGIITFSANKSIVDEEITSYFKGDELLPLINLDDFLKNIGITRYKAGENRVSFQLNGVPVSREIKIIKKFDENLIEVMEIEKIFEGSEIEWDPSALNLDLQTKELLPKEYMESQREKRSRLNNIEEEVTEEKWKVFTPGLLRLGYSKSDIEKDDDYLYMNYTNHTLYGNLNINTSYVNNSSKNELKIDTIKWERNIYDERVLSLGDGYVRKPFNIGENSSFIGASIFSKNSWDRSMDVSSKSVRGYAPTGTTVELYENGILKDFVVVAGSEYRFDIETTGGSRTYEVWIYNSDGTIEKKPIALYGSNNLVKAGEFDYEIQAGQEKNDYESLYNAKLLYGVTEDLTLGVGGYNSQGKNYSKNKKKNDYLNLSFLQRITTRGKWSSIIGGDYSFNPSDREEDFYRMEFSAGNSRVTNTFGLLNYKRLDDDFLTESYDEKFYGRSDFGLWGSSMSLSYEKEKEKEAKKSRDLNRYGVTAYGNLFAGKVSSSLNYSLEDIKEYGKQRYDDRLGLAVSYNVYGKKYQKYLDTITLNYDVRNFQEESYGIRFYKNKGSKEAFDYSLGFRRQQGDNLIELAVSYTFGKAFEIRGRTNHTPDGTKTALETNTTINFGSDKKFAFSNFAGDSNVEGIVFIDKEADGIYNQGDIGVENVKVVNSAGEGRSDKNGRYEIPLLSSKIKHPLRIYNENEDLFLGYIFPEKYYIKTLPGGNLKFNIPVIQVKTLVGLFEFTDDFYLEDVEEFLKSIKINMINLKTKENKVLEVRGETIISEVPQGEYLMQIAYRGENKDILKEQSFYMNLSSGDDLEEYFDFKISRTNEKYILKLFLNDEQLYSLSGKKEKELLTLYKD